MPQRTDKPADIGVGLVGYAFMGRAHSLAWNTVGRVFDVPLRLRLAAICGRDKAATEAAASRFGWAAAETDWRALIARDDVQLVDISAPGDLHAPIAIAALEAGKHVLCEKPLANTLAEAEAMKAAADAAYPGGARARSPSTTRSSSPRSSPRARWPPSRPPGRERRRRRRRVPPRPRHGRQPSLPVRLVAARAHARVGAYVHPPGEGPADGNRERGPAQPVVRRRAGGPASTARGAGKRRERQLMGEPDILPG